MRKQTWIPFVCLAIVSSTFSLHFRSSDNSALSLHSPESHSQGTKVQQPMYSVSAQSQFSGREDHSAGGGHKNLTISDILPKTKGINIFASLTRDVPSISDQLESPDTNLTLLAPLNSAIQNLPRKPWEDRPGGDNRVSAANNQEKAMQNLQQFVGEHLIPVSPWSAGKDHKIKTLGGQELWWEERSGIMVILPDELIVDKVLGGVGNGEVWTIKGVVNYS